jgi:hypothetical protein
MSTTRVPEKSGRALLLAALIALTAGSQARGADMSFSRNARTFETVSSSLAVKSVAHACLGMALIPDSLPCNPAMVPLIAKPRMAVHGLLSNGSQTLDKMRRLITNQVDAALVNDLFGTSRQLQIEGEAGLSFLSSHFTAEYVPYNGKFFSVVRNEANPEISLSAIEEKRFVMQLGKRIDSLPALSIGVQASSVERNYIIRNFKLVDLGTQAGKDLLKSRGQKLFLAEPGAVLHLETPVRSRLSVMIANLGWIEESPELPMQAEPQVGYTLAPTLPVGEMEIELAYRNLGLRENSPGQRFRLGALYRFGAMNLSGGVDYEGLSAGVNFGLDQVNAGIVYATTQTPWNTSEYYTQTVYVQLGWQI